MIGPTQILILLVVVLLVFGTKKLRSAGTDLGGFLRGFKKALNEDEPAARLEADPPSTDAAATKARSEDRAP